tara:strand:+ start:43 stop:723 length:681 start_codon:yes stop_codon:yes gene_type:complete
MDIYKLNKSIYLFKNNAVEFLNGLTSNDMDKPRNAFLNVHGKIVATFDQQKISEDQVLLVLEKEYNDVVFTHIDKYLKLSGIRTQGLENHVYFDLSGNSTLENIQWEIPQKKGRFIISAKEYESNVSDEEFLRFRLRNDIPWLGIDYKDDFLLNVSINEFASFTKGCYLGQEPVSKVYNRSQPTWQLVVRSEQECSEEEVKKMTSKCEIDEKVMGFVFVKNTGEKT